MSSRTSVGFRVVSTVWRAACFLGLWLVLAGAHPADLPAGALATVAATWASLQLLPTTRARISLGALARLILRFPREATIAGTDVAWRALAPRLPLRPGFVNYPATLHAASARSAFCAFTSLLPGALPAGTNARGEIVVHCLDVKQPVVERMAEGEMLFSRAMGDRA